MAVREGVRVAMECDGGRWGGAFGSLYLMTKITNPHVSDSNSSQVIMIDETVSEKIDIQMH